MTLKYYLSSEFYWIFFANCTFWTVTLYIIGDCKHDQFMHWVEKYLKLQEQKGFSHAEIERLAGIKKNTLRDKVENHRNIGVATAERLAHALGVDPGWLINQAEGWPPPSDVRETPPDDRLIERIALLGVQRAIQYYLESLDKADQSDGKIDHRRK